MRLILYGRPITKKNSSRIVKCGNYHRILPSKAYEKYEKECLLQITGKYKLKLDGKYNLKCLYYMPTRHRVDLVNLLEATCDILVAGHVIADDNSKIIVSHDGSRVLYDRVNPRVEIFLEEVVSKNGQ
nr:MAG TPA: Endodeoxyribonuclease RusA [Caudoviricetes sp.]